MNKKKNATLDIAKRLSDLLEEKAEKGQHFPDIIEITVPFKDKILKKNVITIDFLYAMAQLERVLIIDDEQQEKELKKTLKEKYNKMQEIRQKVKNGGF